jgi:GNAT superfamily N-acetyltransferase
MELRHPSPAEVTELTSQISSAFGYGPGEAGVERDFPQLYKPSNIKHLWVASEGGKVAAHAGFYPSLMRVEGIPLPVAGIGGVYTNEAFQGQGFATSLINRCCEGAHKEGAALGFLWSDKHEFYKKQNFHLVGRQWTIPFKKEMAPVLRAMGERAEIPESALLVSEEVDVEFLRQSHALQEIFPIGVSRTPEEHALYLESGASRVVSAWAGGQLAAYFVIGKGRDLQGYVHEWAGAEGALSHLMAQCLEDYGQPLFLLSPQFMPDEVPWIYSLDKAGIPMTAEYLALVRILDFGKLRKLTHDFMARLGLEPNDLVMETLGAGYSIAWRGKPALALDDSGLLRLLFGPDLPADSELQAFLPMRLWYWGMDSV